jgi:hypothetical protein
VALYSEILYFITTQVRPSEHEVQVPSQEFRFPIPENIPFQDERKVSAFDAVRQSKSHVGPYQAHPHDIATATRFSVPICTAGETAGFSAVIHGLAQVEKELRGEFDRQKEAVRLQQEQIQTQQGQIQQLVDLVRTLGGGAPPLLAAMMEGAEGAAEGQSAGVGSGQGGVAVGGSGSGQGGAAGVGGDGKGTAGREK